MKAHFDMQQLRNLNFRDFISVDVFNITVYRLQNHKSGDHVKESTGIS